MADVIKAQMHVGRTTILDKNRHDRFHLLLWIIFCAVVLRLVITVYLGDTVEEVRGGTWDQISYDILAQRVAAGHGFTLDRDWWPATRAGEPTAHWSYVYTLYLAAVYSVVGHHPLVARLLQAVAVGLLMPWLAYRLGRRAFNPRVGLLAAAVVAVYFYFAHYAASLMTEAFYIVGLLWTLDVAMRLAIEMAAPGSGERARRRPARPIWLGLELGLAMGVTFLLRQVVVFFFALLFLWLVGVAWRRGRVGRVFPPLVLAVLAVALLILPWLVRNYLAFGRITFMPNTNSGFAFFWCNHPIYGTQFEPVLSPEHGVSYQDLIPLELRHLDEAALNDALLARGIQFVLDDPGRYFLLSLSRIPIFFTFWPTPESTFLSNAARVLSFGLFLPFMVWGLLLALRRLPKTYASRHVLRQSGNTRPGNGDLGPSLAFEFLVLLLLFVLSYSALHIATWANVRYRLPVDAVLVLFAAFALDRLLQWLIEHRALPRSRPVQALAEPVATSEAASPRSSDNRSLPEPGGQ